jgi:hypothetical protein
MLLVTGGVYSGLGRSDIEAARSVASGEKEE